MIIQPYYCTDHRAQTNSENRLANKEACHLPHTFLNRYGHEQISTIFCYLRIFIKAITDHAAQNLHEISLR